MKRFFLMAVVVLFLFGLTSCGGGEETGEKTGEKAVAKVEAKVEGKKEETEPGKYAEVQETMGKFIKGMEDLTGALQKAESADDVVAALEANTELLIKLEPRMRELEQKFPVLKQSTTENVPEEIKTLNKQWDQAILKTMGTLPVLAKYAYVPKVQEALKRNQEAMRQLTAKSPPEEN